MLRSMIQQISGTEVQAQFIRPVFVGGLVLRVNGLGDILL